MDIEELYAGLNRLQNKGEIGNAYGGCGSDFCGSDSDVLGDFYFYITEEYEKEHGKSIPLWAEAFVQIFDWQFQTLHESAEAYYENFYGNSEYKTILKVAEYLRNNGYSEIAEPYAAAAVNCERYQYPKEMTHLLPDYWIGNNDEIIWHFYVDILEKNKSALLK